MNKTELLKSKLGRFNRQFVTMTHYPRALRFLLASLPRWFNAEKAILLITKESNQWLSFEKAIGFKPINSVAGLLKSDPLSKILQAYPKIIFLDDQPQSTQEADKSSFLKRLHPDFNLSVVIPLTIYGQTWGALLLDTSSVAMFRQETLVPNLLDAGEKTAVTLRHLHLLYTLKRASLEKDLLLETSRNINSTLNMDQLLETILDSLQQVVPYDKGSIFLLDPRSKKIARVARRGPVPLIDGLNFMKKSDGLCTWVLNNSKPVVVHDVSKDPRYFPMYPDTQAELDVPILNRKKIIGVFNLESNRKSAFSKNDRKLVQAFVSQTAVALDNAWLYSELLEKKEMDRELGTAKRLQRALLPRRLPSVDGYDFAALNIPSRTVGGDLYDFIQFSQNRMGFAIGDVAGKGTPGALLMATLYSTYRGMVRLPIPLNQMIFDLNNTLKGRISTTSFMTFFYGMIAADSNELIYCNAGHCHPILLHQDGRYELLEIGGTVLGFVHDAPYSLGKVWLQPGDLLFLHTDGITEAVDPNDEFFGEERLIATLRTVQDLPVKTILRKIFRTVKAFTGEVRLQDDFTVMVIAVSAKSDRISY